MRVSSTESFGLMQLPSFTGEDGDGIAAVATFILFCPRSQTRPHLYAISSLSELAPLSNSH